MINYFLQLSLLSGLLLAYYLLFLRNKPLHLFNRAYLIAAVVVSLATPFLTIPVELTNFPKAIGQLYPLPQAASAGPAIADFVQTPVQQTTGTNRSFWLELALYAYVLVAVLLLLQILFFFRRIYSLLKNNPVEKVDDMLLVKTTSPEAPFVFHKWIFWNRKHNTDSAIAKQILKHERVHVKQHHSIDIIFIEVVTALCWINPFFHLIRKEIRAVHEFLADQAIGKNQDKAVFARLLLSNALGGTSHFMGTAFTGSLVSRRINMMVATQQLKKYRLRMYVSGLLLVLTIVFSSLSAIPGQRNFVQVPVSTPTYTILTEQESLQESLPVKKAPAPSRKEAAPVPEYRMNTVATEELLQNTPAVSPYPDELAVLNYRDNATAIGGSLPEDNSIPQYVRERSATTQVLLNPAKEKRQTQLPLFFPAKRYEELLLITTPDSLHQQPGSMLIRITDERGNLVRQAIMEHEQISGYNAIRISFAGMAKGNYLLQIQSSDLHYSTSCKVVKDYDS